MPPSSKSYAQRALAISLFVNSGTTTLRNIEFCDDTLHAMGCIETLGAKVKRIDDSTLMIEGGFNPQKDTIHVGESGLATRLFTPIASLHNKPITITGEGTILMRPMTMMIDSLKELGVGIQATNGCLPITVCGPMSGGEVTVDGSISSQFLTGLLLSLPLSQSETTIHVDNAVSKPYIDMTIDCAKRFGVDIFHNDYEDFYISGNQEYKAIDFPIEGDWSGAAIMLVAGAIAGRVTINNLSMLSKQADKRICTALVRAGAEVINEVDSVTVSHRELLPFEFDATQCPDLFPALAALASTIEGESTIIGTSRLKYKECHRADAIRDEFSKLGIHVDTSTPNIMKIRGGAIGSGRVKSYGDHRMAMALAVVALRSSGEISIEESECVAKSYPDFFEELDKLRE